MIDATELDAVFRARARELAAGVEMTAEQQARLAAQIDAAARYLVSIVTAVELAWQPVAVAMVEVIVDLGRQLDPRPDPAEPPVAPRPPATGPVQPPAGAGAYKNRGGRR